MKRKGEERMQMYSTSDLGDRKEWIERYAPLVKRIAQHLMARLPASVEFDDIVQAGMVGLLDAVSRYEPAQGAQFETYATQRIRGAIVDELRSNDWLPRGLRQSMRKIEAAISVLEQRHGRPPVESEIAAQLNVPLAEYQRKLQDARAHQLLYAEDFNNGDGESLLEEGAGAQARHNTLDGLLQKELRDRLSLSVAELPEREKILMSLYYEKELNQREIGEVLGVTESRVCQLHSQAVARLRSKLIER
jgi:RNA polymerase sigma factor for flagellar operon FliA